MLIYVMSLFEFLSVFNSFCILGKDANPQERKAAMKTAEEFLQQMNYSTNTQVCLKMNWLEKKSAWVFITAL